MRRPLAALLLVMAATLARAGNPIVPGWYADPEVAVFGDRYWVFPTYSARYEEQTFFDAFSSPDLVTWTKHPRVTSIAEITWARRAMWAPNVVENGGKYYLFFAANDIKPGEAGGLGVAVADKPDGPYRDLLGKPLVDQHWNGAQPIDQSVFRDPTDGQWYLLYGGWRHCNLARLSDDFTKLVPWPDGTMAKEITPEGYTEGPTMFFKGGKVYFMWSEGGWTGPDYQVAYAIADSVRGPFVRLGTAIEKDPEIATGAGHHSVLKLPDRDEYYMVYHRRPKGVTDGNGRVTCVDRMEFNADGTIVPVRMTVEGVAPRPLGK